MRSVHPLSPPPKKRNISFLERRQPRVTWWHKGVTKMKREIRMLRATGESWKEEDLAQ